MSAIMKSISPKECERIVSGEQTILVSKTRPKIDTPFKCYIYCSYGNDRNNYMLGKRGKVIGEFVCDEITQFRNNFFLPSMLWIEKEACLSGEEICKYLGEKESGFAWHISDLKIYDKPIELSKFWTVKCTNKRNSCIGCEVKPNCIKTITRPPQSWYYVEEL